MLLGIPCSKLLSFWKLFDVAHGMYGTLSFSYQNDDAHSSKIHVTTKRICDVTSSMTSWHEIFQNLFAWYKILLSTLSINIQQPKEILRYNSNILSCNCTIHFETPCISLILEWKRSLNIVWIIKTVYFGFVCSLSFRATVA